MPHIAHFPLPGEADPYLLFAFKIVSVPVPTRPGTRTFLQVPDLSRPEVKNPYPSDPGPDNDVYNTDIWRKNFSDFITLLTCIALGIFLTFSSLY